MKIPLIKFLLDNKIYPLSIFLKVDDGKPHTEEEWKNIINSDEDLKRRLALLNR